MGVWWHVLAFVTHERAKMSHKQGRNVTQAGPKCHTRAKMSHSHVIIVVRLLCWESSYVCWFWWYLQTVITVTLILALRARRNEQHFADDIFKRIFFNENVWISIKISLKFVPKGPINNIPSLVQIMAWHWPGDKPLSEPMMARLPTHICVTRPQWVNETFAQQHYFAYWWFWTSFCSPNNTIKKDIAHKLFWHLDN